MRTPVRDLTVCHSASDVAAGDEKSVMTLLSAVARALNPLPVASCFVDFARTHSHVRVP
jgi:hypothetical protein